MADAEGALWLFAGSNGAGKSTFIKDAAGPDGPIAGIPVLNPDWLTKELLQQEGFEDYASVPAETYARCFRRAAKEMEDAAREKLRGRGTVCIETVLSTDKYLPLVAAAKEAGVPFFLVYVVLRSPALACERVSRRVSQGGHPVPTDKIIDRYHRSIGNLPRFAAAATKFQVFDNSDSNAGAEPNLIASGKNGKLSFVDSDAIPQVLEALLVLPIG